jgi:hypothetical protein
MAAFIVACGFQPSPIQSERLAGRLAAYGEFRRVNSGMWLLQAEEEALDILPDLVACVDSEQALFVARLQGDAAWEGYSPTLGSWMTDVMLHAYDCDCSETETMSLALATLVAKPARLNS